MRNFRSLKDVMTPNPIFVNTNTSISTMIQTMEAHGFDHLPVVNDSGNLEGIISKTDIYQKMLSLSKSTSGKTYSDIIINNTTAKEVMTPDPITVDSDQNIEEVLELFYNSDFHSIPVLEQHKLVGIITCKDILSAVNDMQFNEA